MPANAVLREIGYETWNRYYKFTIERNPWDIAVSRFFWIEGHDWGESQKECKAHFRRFVFNGHAYRASNFDLYSIRGVPAMDTIVHFETMQEELRHVSERLALPEDLADLMGHIRAKGANRKGVDYRHLYDADTKTLVATQFAREIALMGYEF